MASTRKIHGSLKISEQKVDLRQSLCLDLQNRISIFKDNLIYVSSSLTTRAGINELIEKVRSAFKEGMDELTCMTLGSGSSEDTININICTITKNKNGELSLANLTRRTYDLTHETYQTVNKNLTKPERIDEGVNSEIHRELTKMHLFSLINMTPKLKDEKEKFESSQSMYIVDAAENTEKKEFKK